MSDALIALLGLVVGAFLGGAVQIALASYHRRQAGRVAARVIYSDLWWAWDAYTYSTAAPQGWWDLDIPLDGWLKYRDPLAAKLTHNDFQILAAAFYAIEIHEQWRKTDVPFRLKPVQEAIPQINKAMDTILDYGLSWREARELRRERARAPVDPPP